MDHILATFDGNTKIENVPVLGFWIATARDYFSWLDDLMYDFDASEYVVGTDFLKYDNLEDFMGHITISYMDSTRRMIVYQALGSNKLGVFPFIKD